MSFQISKNKMSFVADNKQVSKKLTTTTEKVVEKGTTFLIDTVSYLVADEIFHATFQFRAYLPNLPIDNLPEGLTVTVNDSLTEECKITINGDYILGASVVSNTTPITSIKFNVTANPYNHFIFPVGSVLHYGVSPNESQEIVANIPTPPAIIATRFAGLPANLDCAMIHPNQPDVFMGFKGDVIYYQSIASESEHSSIGSVAATFPEVTGTLQYAFRCADKGVNSDGHDTFWQVWLYNSNIDYFRYEFVNGNFVFLGTGNHSWKDYTAQGESWQLVFKDDSGVQKVDAVGNTGNFQPYGSDTSLYPTLPNTSPVTAVVNDLVNNRVLALIDSTMYSLTGSPANSVTEFWTYG
jgi:hypothetical protein